MRFTFASILTACVLAIGCENPNKSATPPAPAPNATSTAPAPPPDIPAPTDIKMPADATATPPAAAPPTAPPEGFTPVPVEAGIVKLTSENTTVQVVGTHLPPRQPDPRTIVFEKFTGQITFDPATKLPKMASAEIDATSLVAFDPGLTTHLKSRDFIEVESYPTIKFQSMRIEPSTEPGKVTIVGNLTLKDVTKEVSIPATVTHDGSGVTVHGKTQLARRDFNINSAGAGGTVNEFDFTLAVGKKTELPAGGGPRRRRGGG